MPQIKEYNLGGSDQIYLIIFSTGFNIGAPTDKTGISTKPSGKFEILGFYCCERLPATWKDNRMKLKDIM